MDEIINDFHDLDQIPVFQTQIDPEDDEYSRQVGSASDEYW